MPLAARVLVFFALPLAQPHAGATAVFVDEFHPSAFEGADDGRQRRRIAGIAAGFNIGHRVAMDIGTEPRNVRFVPKADIMRHSKNYLYDWLPEAIADLIKPRLGARFVKITAGRTTDADRGNGIVANLDAQRARL